MLAVQPDFSNSNERSANPIRVMLVDDSVVARSIFERILSQSERVEIVCQAENPEIALQLLHDHVVDIILLDIEMPGRSGLEALPDILKQSKGARIMVVSSFAEENGPAAIQALSLGACDTLAKPGRSGFSGRFSQTLLEKVIHLGFTEREIETSSDADFPAKTSGETKIDVPACIAVGASTGGIPAIYDVIGNLDPSIDCPIFITQHLPDAFMTFFAKQLAGQTSREVCVAEPGQIVQDNYIYIAPGQAHLICRQQGKEIVIDHLQDYHDSRYCPSVDAMFASIAEIYGDRAVGVVLSGMGNDGTAGAKTLSETGAKIIVQDSQTSVVWGMPGSVYRAELAHSILPAAKIGALISQSAQSTQSSEP